MQKQSSKFKTLIITLCVAGIAALFGCASFMDATTPCYIPPDVIREVDANLPLIRFMPYTSVFDARYVRTKLQYQYLFHKNLLDESIRVSEDFQQRMFSPEGPLGLLIPGTMFGTLGLFAGGRFIKSPREKELETIVNGNNKEKS